MAYQTVRVQCAQCDSMLEVEVFYCEQTFWQPEEFDFEIAEQLCDCRLENLSPDAELAFNAQVLSAYWEARSGPEPDEDMADWWEQTERGVQMI